MLIFILTTWEQRYSIPKISGLSLLHEHFHSSDAMLLFDALDETMVGDNVENAETSYKRVARIIRELCTRYEKVLVVVTSRKEGYCLCIKLAGFTELEMLDFGTQGICQFLQKWFDQYRNSQRRCLAAKLQRLFEQNPRISALAANPLLLTLIVLAFEDRLSRVRASSEKRLI